MFYAMATKILAGTSGYSYKGWRGTFYPDDLAHAGTRSGRILVVDDEPLVLRSMERVLRRIGYEVLSCRAPEEALACFESEPQSFDVVVTDYMMPHMTGIQLSERLIATRPDVPILLISGSPAQVDKARARGAGIRRVIAKPVSVNEFRKSLDQVKEEAGS